MSVDLGTELGPAISLAYEPAESDIMTRPPRSLANDRLVSRNLLIYSYLIIGLAECAAGLWAYIWVLSNFNLRIQDLVDERNDFGKSAKKPFCIHHDGQRICYDRDQQIHILGQASAAFYITLVISQLFHMINVKSTHVSIFKHDWSNMKSLYGALLTLGLLAFFVYTPHVQTIMSTANVYKEGWVPPLACGLFIFLFTEWRRWYIRTHSPTSCLSKWLLEW